MISRILGSKTNCSPAGPAPSIQAITEFARSRPAARKSSWKKIIFGLSNSVNCVDCLVTRSMSCPIFKPAWIRPALIAIAVMKGGVIQQLDDPHVIYNEPKNLYVAGFIGSPTMNFIKGDTGGTVVAPSVAICKGKVALKEYAAKGKLKIGQAVVFGVRPEHLRLNAGNEPGLSDALDATVVLIEPMGSDSLVWLKLAGQILSARVESSQIHKPNEKITVRFRVGFASLFDAESGERL